ncbi:phosphate-starvation-inducible PsiE family protein [Pyrobaculum neutrophilum]|uniref:Phosphate-starvation-inducible E-like protein n=1 Tax=Pyrobaculum neutrophilum (strain DSM 2338 / JCM 9278 / NBRC 100436 / V24Sta) TaxID=444157 RepID=B1Y8P5_PYRNV|nr:phosphate-starvation-inducible PsiE family protein [Pyrobaculum neutrophilum]ACB40124.1 conserved hypothetical protein [Pyrobaculum neutrophilum V24Sta]
MDLVRGLRQGEYLVYFMILILTAVLLAVSLYLSVLRIYELFALSYSTDKLAQAIYIALSDIFLAVVFVELIDTFVTYIERKKIVVYKIIDVALVALARELFVYLAPVNKEFQIEKAAAIVAATLVVGIIDFLQRKTSRR